MESQSQPPGAGGSASSPEEADARLEKSLENISEEASRILSDQAVHHPYRLALIAAGVGYVLGGGLPTWAMRLGLSLGTRMVVNNALSGMVKED